MHHHHILIVGPNGSGKTTHGRLLAACLLWQYVDMSRVIKLAMKFWPGYDSKVAPYMAEGELVPDELLMSPLETYFSTLQENTSIVCSGVPRAASQVEPFIKIVGHTVGSAAYKVVDLQLAPELAIKRCADRAAKAIAANQVPREDDDPTKVRRRLQLHEASKKPLFDELAIHGAEIIPVECDEDPQRTFGRVIHSLAIRNALFIKPALAH